MVLGGYEVEQWRTGPAGSRGALSDTPKQTKRAQWVLPAFPDLAHSGNSGIRIHCILR